MCLSISFFTISYHFKNPSKKRKNKIQPEADKKMLIVSLVPRNVLTCERARKRALFEAKHLPADVSMLSLTSLKS